MLRFLFRIMFTFLIFVLGRLIDSSSRRGGRLGPRDPGRFGPRDAGRGSVAGGSGRGSSVGGSGRDSGGARPDGARGGTPPLDKSDAMDVPYTEIPPPDAAPGTAGQP